MNSREYPFIARAYGGYTSEQVAYFLRTSGFRSAKSILDPMSGQGFALADLVYEGRSITLSDINPAVLHLASLRDPALRNRAQELYKLAREFLTAVDLSAVPKERVKYCERMLAPITALQLREYGTSVNLAMTGDSELKTFLTGLAIIAARQITCFRKSDNYAWIKPGGLYENWDLRQCLFDALEVWMTYALNLHITDCHIGVLETRVNDIRYSRPLPEFRSVDAVVCSPPYANRLDYSRMWLPELAVYSELFGADIDAVRSMQIGTPIVRGRKSEVAVFSSIARECLDRIKNGDGKASDQYYYPFFQNYTVELEAGLENAGECLSSGGSCVVFVRDTVRKDEIFPTGKIVEELFVRKLGFSLLSCERKVIRHHIGMRRGVSSSLYGLGQQEWWLEFRKN